MRRSLAIPGIALTFFILIAAWPQGAKQPVSNDDDLVPYDESLVYLTHKLREIDPRTPFVDELDPVRGPGHSPDGLKHVSMKPSPEPFSSLVTRRETLLFPWEAKSPLWSPSQIGGGDGDTGFHLFGPWVLEDFVQINRQPLVDLLEDVSVAGYKLQRRHLKQIDADVKAFLEEKGKLEKLLAQEQKLADRAESPPREVAAIWKAIDEIAGSHPANPNIDPFELAKQEYRRELPQLYGLRSAIGEFEKQDKNLFAAYRRKQIIRPIHPIYENKNVNRVTPLIDSQTMYGRLDELLENVLKNARGRGYVHIALWQCQYDTLLAPGHPFGARLREVAGAGNEVRLLLWSPVADYSGAKASNEECAKQLDASVKAAPSLAERQFSLERMMQPGAGDPIRVYLASHSSWTGALHEKYFIVNDGANTAAIVGGMNVGGEAGTAAPHRNGGNPWTGAHDVALEIQGLATADVEKDFNQRWAVSGIPARLRSLTVPRGDQEVTIATTGPFGANGAITNDIEKELEARIAAAKGFIYLENYSVTDPHLLDLLAGKVKTEHDHGSHFLLIVHVPDAGEPRYSWLHRLTYIKMSLPIAEQIEWEDPSGAKHVIKRSEHTKWELDLTGHWYAASAVVFDNPRTDVQPPENSSASEDFEAAAIFSGRVPVDRITRLVPDVPLYTVKYVATRGGAAQGIPEHAKIAIFDDEYAMVGSSNFNPRSMRFDGELSAFWHGSEVKDFRRQLWHEYEPSEELLPQTWRTKAEQNVANAATLGVGQHIFPMRAEDFVHAKALEDNTLPLIGPDWY